MSDLKPCPFCNGKAEYSDGKFEHYGLDTPHVFCQDCYVRNFTSTKEKAIKAWNTRSNPDE
jgi:Lar family restriction alleviation protein